MTGISLIIAFVVAIAAMILLIAKCKVHPFLAIMAVSLVLALVAGIPLTKVPGVIGSGFASTFTSIGIVIILGAFIGAVLEKTGAALRLADRLLEGKEGLKYMLIAALVLEIALLAIGYRGKSLTYADYYFLEALSRFPYEYRPQR